MQRNFWNWLDEDLTADINKWLLGILQPGLYRGFDFSPTANLTLNLIQSTTGIKKVKTDETETGYTGVILTRQGVVITEDATVTVAISANNNVNPRIDTIVYEHLYVETEGGAAATLLVIQGTPDANPVAPALTFPNKQTKIGQLYIPGNTNLLNAAGVAYTKEPIPFLGNHGDNFLYTDVAKTITAEDVFEKLVFAGEWYETGVNDAGTGVRILPAWHTFIFNGELSTLRGMDERTAGTLMFVKFEPSGAEEGEDVVLEKITAGAGGDSENFLLPAGYDTYTIPNGDVGVFISRFATEADTPRLGWQLLATLRGENALLNEVNEYTMQQRESKGVGTYAANKITLDDAGNFYAVTFGATGLDAPKWISGKRTGTGYHLRIINGCVITPDFVTGIPADYMRLDTYDGNPMIVPDGSLVYVREETDRVVVESVCCNRDMEVIELEPTGDNEAMTISPKTEYARVINNTDFSKPIIKTIEVQAWHKPGSMITLELGNRYNATRSAAIANRAGGVGNCSFDNPTNAAGLTYWTGNSMAAGSAKLFITFMYNGTFWEEQYRTMTYAV